MTSSAVTGSSAITSFGLHARAIAIITRCRMPPENSCGKSRRRSRLMPTSSRRSPTRFIASSSSTFSWRMMGSAICRPMFRTGFREFIAPWKMIETSFQRIRWIESSDSLTRFLPLNRISPLTILPLYGRSRMTASAVVVFPQPLSPASPRPSPSPSSNETPWSARTGPAWVVYSMKRSLTSNRPNLPPPEAWVQDLIERVSEQVETEDEEHDAQSGDDEPPGVVEHRVVVDCLGNDASPAHRIGRSQSEEREDTLRKDRDGDGEHRGREDQGERVRED